MALEMGDMIAGKMWRLSDRFREQARSHIGSVPRQKSNVGASLLAKGPVNATKRYRSNWLADFNQLSQSTAGASQINGIALQTFA